MVNGTWRTAIVDGERLDIEFTRVVKAKIR